MTQETPPVNVTPKPLDEVLDDARRHYQATQAHWRAYDDRAAGARGLDALAAYAEVDARVSAGEEPPTAWRRSA